MKDSLIFWFSGLSGSGKTTVAKGVKTLLEADRHSALIIDGDDIRRRLHFYLGFTEENIKENNALIAKLCQTHREDYDVILVSIISPYASSRQQARELLGKGFFEIYFSASLETVIKRDVKGLYSKAKQKEIDNLIGCSPGAVYEPPQGPDFVVSTDHSSVEESICDFYNFIIEQLKKANDDRQL